MSQKQAKGHEGWEPSRWRGVAKGGELVWGGVRFGEKVAESYHGTSTSQRATGLENDARVGKGGNYKLVSTAFEAVA